MEDKEMMKIIQENHEKEYKNYIKTIKKEKIQDRVLILLAIIGIIAMIISISNMTEKAINKCVELGYDYNYCFEELSK